MLRRFALTLSCVAALVIQAAAAAARAALTTAPAADPAAAGLVLLGELNCVACHPASAAQAAWITPKAAPRLAEIGGRVGPEWLLRYLAAPHETAPGVTMPDTLGALPAAERPAAAEALTHFLLAASPPTARPVLPDRAAVRRGEVLYHNVGCVACHPPLDGKAAPPPQGSSPLANTSQKWRFDGLRRFLRDPLAVRPSGRMPSLNLTDAEAADIAHFLLRETRTPATLEVSQLRGPIHALEDFDSAEPARTGPADRLSLDGLSRDRGALRFSGWLQIDQPGGYTFYMTSAGAGRLSVDGQWLIGRESWRRERVDGRATLRLHAGPHAIVVDFAQRGQKEPLLAVEWEGPGIARGVIPPSHLRATKEIVPEPPPFAVDPAKAAAGRTLFAELNCTACHEGKPAAAPAPPALAAMDPTRGCLAEKPPPRAADFHLAPAQRDLLRAALAQLRQPGLATPRPRQRLHHTLATLRCTACHARDGTGGVPADRDGYFTSAGDDLGDEGRLPPRLDGVGDKLRPDAIAAVLRGAPVRPYLNTRMPQFGEANTSHLPDLVVAIDRRAIAVKAVTDTPDVQREVGRRLVGTDGLSCIACHRFNRQPAQAMQVVDLVGVTDRLNEDWFRQFLVDPNKFHPGTRMPSFWPEGKSPMPAVLDGDTARQQAAIWTYLSDGGRAKFPVGLGRQNVELVVGGEAVVYRGKLWEAGFRAIATGYPGQMNVAFDAEEGRLSLLWRGRFLNAGPHWTVQGMGQIRPLGTDVVVLPHGSALAILADAESPWPQTPPRELGLKFRGYQLDSSNQPTLLYAFDDRQIEDFTTPVDGKSPALRRTITFVDAPPANLHMRLAAGRLASAGEGSWRLGDGMTLRIKGATGTLRGEGDQRELIVTIPVGEKGHRLEVDYAW